jgi:hypothetical protein
MTLQEINRSIISGTFSNEDLNSITDAIKFVRAQLASKAKYTFKVGSTVKFTNARSGTVVLGTVDKVNRKFIIVRENGKAFGGSWRVPANMLTAA